MVGVCAPLAGGAGLDSRGGRGRVSGGTRSTPVREALDARLTTVRLTVHAREARPRACCVHSTVLLGRLSVRRRPIAIGGSPTRWQRSPFRQKVSTWQAAVTRLCAKHYLEVST